MELDLFSITSPIPTSCMRWDSLLACRETNSTLPCLAYCCMSGAHAEASARRILCWLLDVLTKAFPQKKDGPNNAWNWTQSNGFQFPFWAYGESSTFQCDLPALLKACCEITVPLSDQHHFEILLPSCACPLLHSQIVEQARLSCRQQFVASKPILSSSCYSWSSSYYYILSSDYLINGGADEDDAVTNSGRSAH